MEVLRECVHVKYVVHTGDAQNSCTLDVHSCVTQWKCKVEVHSGGVH